MPSRKQRRRREKLQRHEYEYVIETEEGEEVPIEKPAEPPKKDGKRPARAAPQRGGREMQKPSMARVVKRTAIFAPIILVIVWVFTASTVSTTAKLFNAVALIAFFIPFSYLVDVLMYRVFSKRQQRGSGSG